MDPMSKRLPTANAESAERTRPVRVLQLTDFHFLARGKRTTMFGVDTEQSFRDTVKAALQSGPPPDLALLTGDLVQDPEVSAYQRLKDCLSALPCPAYALPGNHDDAELIAVSLADPNLHFQPSVLLDHWQIVCLDSTIRRQPYGRLSEEQLAGLDSLLAGQPQRFALVALHHHPVPSGSLWMDTMLLENHDRFFEVLARHNQVRGVVFGHVHQTMDIERRGLRILGTPSTCFQFKPFQAAFSLDRAPPGYRWIELHPDGTIETTVGRTPDLPAGFDMAAQGY
jgi:Icc protein